MTRAVINIVVGLIGIGLGLSGKAALIGTNSGYALAGLGGAIALYGVYAAIRSMPKKR